MHLLVVLILGWLIFMMHQKKVMRKGATRAELSTFTFFLKFCFVYIITNL